MDFSEKIADLASKANSNRDEATEIIGPDGLRHCAKCGGARQARVAAFGGAIVPCLCRCQSAERDAKAEGQRERERVERLSKFRAIGLPYEQIRHFTFAADDGSDPATMQAAIRFCEFFPQMRGEGRGLLLYGPVGSGKSFAAACIFNDLVQRGFQPVFTSVQRVVEATKDQFYRERMRQIDALSLFDLVVLDDLGVERHTSFMAERVFDIVDGLYRSRTSVIVTTNSDPRSMRDDSDLSRSRIYDRLLERCHPICVSKESRRKDAGRRNFAETNDLLGL